MRLPTPLPASLRRIGAPGATVLTDAELVGRFADRRDAAAFEVLVWRHGPMVWATCRRILRHQQDAEDAFQTAFVALAGSARSIRDTQVLGGWLHRVAANAALKLKAARRPSALPAEVLARADANPDGGELAGAVDEELSRLPARLRAAFVLCCLEGLTSAEAARDLGCPVGTVESRLHAARTRLRDRLTRRGFGPGAVAGLVVIASPPHPVLAAAVAVGAGVCPDPALRALAAQVSRTVNRGVLTTRAGICAVLAASLAGTVWAFGGAGEPAAPRPEARRKPASPPAPADPPATAWGEPVMGLQAGLRCPKQSLDAGESVEVEVVVRNVGKEPAAFEYLAWENQSGGSVFLSGVPERGELRLGWVSFINGIPQLKSARLGPHEEVVRGRVTLAHRRAGAGAPGARPPIELAPGKYRVSIDPVGEPTHDRLGGAAFPRLGTGVLELTLSEPRAHGPAAGGPPAPLAVPKPPVVSLKPDPKAGPVGDEFKGRWTGEVASPDGNNVRGMVLRFVDGKHLAWTTTQATPGVRSTFTTRFEYAVKDGELILRVLETYYGEEKVPAGPDDQAPQTHSFAWTGDKKDGFRIRNTAARESPWATVTLTRTEERVDPSDPLVFPALRKVDRAIKKEPAYTGTPLYLLLAIGPDAESRVWVVLDGTNLYVDRNRNGDLTEAGEMVAVRAAAGTKPDPRSPEFLVGELPGPAGVKHTDVLVSVVRTPAIGATARVMMRVGGTTAQMTVLPLAGSPTDARVAHFGGRVVTARPSVSMPDAPDANGPTDFRVQVGTPGVGAGSFVGYGNADLPARVGPVADFVFTPADPGGAPERVTVRLTGRCCGDQFSGELTVPPGARAGLGAAAVTLSFPDCPWGAVRPATYPVDVIPKRR